MLAQDEVIDDPEVGPATPQPAAATTPGGFEGDARLRLHARVGLDVYHSDPREEVWESSGIANLETTLRRSDDLRIALGVRARYHAAWLEQPVADAGSRRIDFGAVVTAGYVDLGVADGLHVQLGYQPVQLGRFDLISAVDVLSAFDWRDGPATMPEAYQLAQFAARVDYDPAAWLALRVLYVPFFIPHLISLVEGDYAVARQTQASIDAETSSLGVANRLATYLSRADRERLAQSGLAALTPEPDLASQQAALRLTLHGAAGELAFTAATALEHVPALYFTQEAIDSIADPTSADVGARLAAAQRPVRVEYGRFAVIAIDGALDVTPLSLGFEAAYSWHRTLYTLGSGDYPDTLPLPDTTDVVQLGAKLEYVHESSWLVTLEAFGAYALEVPRDPGRGWMFLTAGRFLIGAALATVWSPWDRLRVTLGALAFTGPSVFLAPSLAYELLSGLEIELGGVIVQGPAPPLVVTPQLALGTLWDTTDQVFVGLVYTL
ncbi:MAG TPA: hypothetical protein VJR89_16030 [Polyangiales bacterium]|nr:hypothetical protein [Polyangiales bacterium]